MTIFKNILSFLKGYLMQKQYLPELIESNRVYLKRYKIKFAKELYKYVSAEKSRLAEFLTWPRLLTLFKMKKVS